MWLAGQREGAHCPPLPSTPRVKPDPLRRLLVWWAAPANAFPAHPTASLPGPRLARRALTLPHRALRHPGRSYLIFRIIYRALTGGVLDDVREEEEEAAEEAKRQRQRGSKKVCCPRGALRSGLDCLCAGQWPAGCDRDRPSTHLPALLPCCHVQRAVRGKGDSAGDEEADEHFQVDVDGSSNGAVSDAVATVRRRPRRD